jgi:hypothetical protein
LIGASGAQAAETEGMVAAVLAGCVGGSGGQGCAAVLAERWSGWKTGGDAGGAEEGATFPTSGAVGWEEDVEQALCEMLWSG